MANALFWWVFSKFVHFEVVLFRILLLFPVFVFCFVVIRNTSVFFCLLFTLNAFVMFQRHLVSENMDLLCVNRLYKNSPPPCRNHWRCVFIIFSFASFAFCVYFCLLFHVVFDEFRFFRSSCVFLRWNFSLAINICLARWLNHFSCSCSFFDVIMSNWKLDIFHHRRRCLWAFVLFFDSMLDSHCVSTLFAFAAFGPGE